MNFAMLRGTIGTVIISLMLLIATYVFVYGGFFEQIGKKSDNIAESIRWCQKPFVKIGKSCYFFSDITKPKDFYKIYYKNRFYNIPKRLNWLTTLFGCETLDSRARAISIDSMEEMKLVANYMSEHYEYFSDYYMFWSSGHRSRLNDLQFDANSVDKFYWSSSSLPMNYTNWLEIFQPVATYPDGFCVYLQLINDIEELVMATQNCDNLLPYACELERQDVD